jgi:hypothetical protein
MLVHRTSPPGASLGDFAKHILHLWFLTLALSFRLFIRLSGIEGLFYAVSKAASLLHAAQNLILKVSIPVRITFNA